MEAPLIPIDIKIEMGSDKNNQNLLNIQLDFTDNDQYVKEFLKEKKFPQQFGQYLVLMFDLNVQQGRENDAIQYFKSGNGKAPLQIVFSNRPSEQNQTIKFEIEKHEGFVRLFYKFILDDPNNPGLVYANQILDAFQAHQVRLQSHLSWTLRGKISHNNKNRTNVLVDYSKFQFVSNAFCSEKFFNCVSTFEEIKNNCQYYLNHPYFALVKKSKVAKLHLKMSQFRKVSKYYRQVSHIENEPQEKSSKYTNKGIFRQKADAVLIFKNQYMIKINGKYESEDAFQRLIKVYSKFFDQLFKANFYKDD